MSNFLAPLMLGTFALLAPLIVIMYLLKLKRAPRVVPSTLLWRKSVQDLVANAPFQRLRNNLLMWLQLLILLLLALALAQPVMRMTGLGGRTIIVLLDLSASMQAKESDGETRLDKAKKLAMEAVDQMSVPNPLVAAVRGRDEMMIIGFADKTIPLQTLTSDKGLLRTAIDNATAYDTETNLKDAGLILQEKTLVRVQDRMEANPNTRVLFISDGRVGPSIASLNDIKNMDYVAVGEAKANLGFTSAEVREAFAGTFEYQLFATVFNSSDEPADAFVELQVAAEVLDMKKVTVPPRASAPVVFTLGEKVTGLATLRFTDHEDAFPLDDVIRVNIAPSTDLKVLIVSKGNLFLERAFSADPRVTVSTIAPDSFTTNEGYDITVMDGVPAARIPAELGPGNYLFVNCLPPPSTGFGTSGEPIERPRVVDWNRVHPLTRYADFQDLVVAEASRITMPKDAVALVQALDSDLIAVHESESRRIVMIGFDILKSYWPVDVSFPIFFSNLVDYWARTGRGINKPSYTAGAIIPIAPPRDVKKVAVHTPDKRKIEYQTEGQSTLYLTETTRAGLYQIDYDDKPSKELPVNVASALESDIAPAEELEVGGQKLQANRGSVKTKQDLWPFLVLGALAILMLEWAIYCRRTFM